MFKRLASIHSLAALLAYGANAHTSDSLPEICQYRQAGASLPALQVSSADVGNPWRALYGYCLRGGERFVLHQDWALSFLDADNVNSSEGGEGVGIGTDLLIRWHNNWRPAWWPFLEAGAGLQYAAGTPFPADGSRWMFTVQAGAGWLIPQPSARQLTLGFRYLHISNAGYLGENSGYDVVHLVLGIRWGTRR